MDTIIDLSQELYLNLGRDGYDMSDEIFPSHAPGICAVFSGAYKQSLAAVRDAAEQLSTEEQQELARFTNLRRATQFLYGRLAAKAALEQLSEIGENYSVGRGATGEPVWPPGLLGSISHTDAAEGATAVAIVADSKQERSLCGVGIDIESVQRAVEPGLAARILSEAERRELLADLEEGERNLTLLAALSAKEAIYKAIWPIVQRRVGFLEVELEKISCDTLSVSFNESLAGALPDGSELLVSQKISSSLLCSIAVLSKKF